MTGPEKSVPNVWDYEGCVAAGRATGRSIPPHSDENLRRAEEAWNDPAFYEFVKDERIAAVGHVPKSAVDPNCPLVPSEEEIKKLPRWARLGVAFAASATRDEFRRVRTSLRRQVNLILWVLLPLLVVVTGLGMVVAVYKSAIGGGLILVASLTSLLVAQRYARRLGFDQAMLELVPVTYNVMFKLCQTDEQFNAVFRAFLSEMSETRSNLWRCADVEPESSQASGREGA